MCCHDELSSKFRLAKEFHLWLKLAKGSGARQGVHLGAQTHSLHTEANGSRRYFRKAHSLNMLLLYSLYVTTSGEGSFLWECCLGFV